MKLFETIYMKIIDKDKIYYLLYKSYADDFDGRIDVEEIDKKRYLKSKEVGLKIEEKEFGNARFGIKRRIEYGEFEGVKREEI
jgi:hypothetical protein